MAEERSWLKWAGIGCGGLILLFVAFIGVIFLFVKTATAGPEEVAKQFLAATAAGDYARAHETFSAPLKESQPLDAFTAAVRGRPTMFKVKDVSYNNRSVDMSGARLSGTATLEAGTEVPVSFTFAKENGNWKLLAYHLGANDTPEP